MKKIFHGIKILFKFRVYTVINLIGLILSLISVFIIARYVFSEYNTDRYIQKLDRLYTTTVEGYTTTGAPMFMGNLNFGNEPEFQDISKANGIERVSAFRKKENCSIDYEQWNYKLSICLTDSNFLQLFDYPLLEGTVSNNTDAALISYATAQKLFGKESPVGKVLKDKTSNKEYVISGVLSEPKTHASFSFDLLALSKDDRFAADYQWAILLYPDVDYKNINQQFADPFLFKYWNMNLRYQLFPYKDIYFNSTVQSSVYERGNAGFLYLLILAAIILLIVGIVNYSNIYTVIVMHRFKEFGMKKVTGIQRKELFGQLFFENLFICLLALIISMASIQLLQPLLANHLMLTQKANVAFDLIFCAIILLILPLLVTLYPFFRYQYNTPIHSLKGIVMTDRSSLIRNGVLCFQYLVTLVMLVVSFYFMKQLNVMLHADMGYKTEQIIKVPLFPAESEIKNKASYMSVIAQKMNESTLFENWTLGYSPNVITTGANEVKFKREGHDFKALSVIGTWNNWMEMFGIEIEKGENWKEASFEESHNRLIISKSAAKLLDIDINNFESTYIIPETPIWTRGLHSGFMDMNLAYQPYEIVGIVDDIFISHLGRNQAPTALFYTRGGDLREDLMATVVKGREEEAVTFLKDLHQEIVGGVFTYTFLEDEIAALYATDKKLSKTYTIFAIILILITSIGLFAISLFDINRRYKEIGIRKINGARMKDILSILSRKYIMLLLFAFILSIPVSLWLIKLYVENYAIKADIGIGIFAAAFIITGLISFATIVYQSWKVLTRNPIDILKVE